MKLYTEEQVRKLIDGYYDVNWTIYDEFDEIIPIELPSEEKIIDNSPRSFDHGELIAFIVGAKWVIGEIKQQADGE